MRKTVYVIALLISIQTFGQELESELIKSFDSEFSQRLVDYEIKNNNLIYLLLSYNSENQSNRHYLIFKLDFNGKVLSQKRIETMFSYYDIVVSDNETIFLLGSKDGADIDMIDYVSIYDKSFNNFKNFTLETKIEGTITGFSINNGVVIGTNSKSEYVVYKIDNTGKILKKQNFNHDIAETLENIVPIDNGLIIYGWSMKDWKSDSRVDLIKLSDSFELKDSVSFIFSKKVPVKFKLFENSESILLWDSIAPVSTFFDTGFGHKNSINYLRHDMKIKDVCSYGSDQFLYSGKLGDNSVVFLVNGNKIIEKLSFENLGTWGKNKIDKLSENEFIFITDAIRTNDFDIKVQIYRITKK